MVHTTGKTPPPGMFASTKNNIFHHSYQYTFEYRLKSSYSSITSLRWTKLKYDLLTFALFTFDRLQKAERKVFSPKFVVQPPPSKTEAVVTRLDFAIEPSRCQQQILPKQPPQKIYFLTIHLCAQYVPVCCIFAKLRRQKYPVFDLKSAWLSC